jgi:O-antigen/teichoic acid export membrane protein
MNTEPGQDKKFIIIIKTFFNSIKTRIIARISTDPLLKGIVIIGSGSAIAQILGIIFVPILTRIYPPDIYGTLAVFGSLLSILIVVSSFKYEYAIPVPENDDDAEYLLILSFLIVCTLSIILLVILIVAGDFLAGIFHFEFIAPYYWLFCVGFVGISVYQILTFWALRSKDYFTITQTRITQSISGSVSKIILGMLSFGSFGLICGEIIGRMVGIGTLGRTILPKIWQSIHNLDFSRLRSVAVKYKKFPEFSMPAGFINELSLQAPTLLLASMFGFETAGLFSLSYSMLVLPVSLISNSIMQVYFGEISELYRQKSEKILPLFLETTKKLFIFGTPIILIGAVIFPIFFPLIFGSAWKDAGMFSLPLSILVISNFVVASTDRLDLYGFNQWQLAWNICRTTLVLFGFFIASVFMFSPVITVLIYSLIMTVFYAICYVLNIKAIHLVLQRKEENITDSGKII